jgi:hypothetical protein
MNWTKENMTELVTVLGNVRQAITFRDEMTKTQPDFPRAEFNQAIYRRMKRVAYQNTEQLYASDKCIVKGHKFVIANGYQSLYDNGADVPVQCVRCGQWDM